MMAWVVNLLTCLVCLHPLLASGQDTGDTTLTLPSTQGTVRSRVGCNVVVFCSGVGVDLVWRRFGNRDVRLETNVTMNGSTIQGNLVFDPIDVGDRGSYTCEIQKEDTDDSEFTVMSLLVFVGKAPIEIVLEDTNFDISIYALGEVASIACPVSTCHDNVRVMLLKDDDLVSEGMLTGTSLNRVYNFNLDVTESIVGTYTCKADFSGDSAMADFNITGTPRIDPLPIPMSVTPTVFPTATPTTATKEPDAGLSIVAQLPLVTVLLLIAVATLLL